MSWYEVSEFRVVRLEKRAPIVTRTPRALIYVGWANRVVGVAEPGLTAP